MTIITLSYTVFDQLQLWYYLGITLLLRTNRVIYSIWRIQFQSLNSLNKTRIVCSLIFKLTFFFRIKKTDVNFKKIKNLTPRTTGGSRTGSQEPLIRTIDRGGKCSAVHSQKKQNVIKIKLAAFTTLCR